VEALGIDLNSGAKFCKAYFVCDMDKARELDKDVVGRHYLTAYCFQNKQANEAGNPNFVKFIIRLTGDGGHYSFRFTGRLKNGPQETASIIIEASRIVRYFSGGKIC
jgi:CRISPR/Cas system CMR subunit Cmr6 (Cas7 group RAMP superfamily)